MHYDNENTFDEIFPLGLPVGSSKPNVTVSYQRGIQRFAWQENESLAVLKGDIYPNFCMFDFNNWINSGDKLSKFAFRK